MTTDRPTPSEIEAIRERHSAISSWPWKYDPKTFGVSQNAENGARWQVCRVLMTSDLDSDCREQASVNGPFIAHAPVDIDTLLREVAELTRERNELLAIVNSTTMTAR